MEFRITAEDPYQDFRPSPGRIDFLRPAGGPGVRDDSGVFSGWEVQSHYDPLIAKLIVWGRDRQECLARAKRALEEYRVEGISTTLPFFQQVLRDPQFLAGEMDVGYIDRNWRGSTVSAGSVSNPVSIDVGRDRAALIAAAVAAYRSVGGPRRRTTAEAAPSVWKRAGIREQHGSRL